MAISVVDGVKAWTRALHFPTDPGVQSQLLALKSYLAAQKNNPDLQCVEFDHLIGTTTVIADAACKIYAVILIKSTTTTAVFKATDHASTGSTTAGNITTILNSLGEIAYIYPDGLPMANGFVALSNTTATGSTTSAAGDGPKGLVLLGRP